jgi:molybdopterin synthase sulfur carrier subunit
MKVNFYATLRQIVGAKTVDFDLAEGATIGQLLDEMMRCYPALCHELMDDQGNLYQHVQIFVKGREASHLEKGLDTPLSSEDSVGIFPAVGGG